MAPLTLLSSASFLHINSSAGSASSTPLRMSMGIQAPSGKMLTLGEFLITDDSCIRSSIERRRLLSYSCFCLFISSFYLKFFSAKRFLTNCLCLSSLELPLEFCSLSTFFGGFCLGLCLANAPEDRFLISYLLFNIFWNESG